MISRATRAAIDKCIQSGAGIGRYVAKLSDDELEAVRVDRNAQVNQRRKQFSEIGCSNVGDEQKQREREALQQFIVATRTAQVFEAEVLVFRAKRRVECPPVRWVVAKVLVTMLAACYWISMPWLLAVAVACVFLGQGWLNEERLHLCDSLDDAKSALRAAESARESLEREDAAWN